jgi:hypothetical protein
MQRATHSTARFVRFAVWVLLMLTACLIADAFAPPRVVLVPCLFMVLFVPVVLLPMHSNKSGRSDI